MNQQHAAPSAQRLLERTGLAPTLNRILILSVLLDSHSALSARQVFDAVRRQHRLNRTTVYRILELLADKGVVNRISFGNQPQHFCVGDHHCHFHCTCCGNVQCMETADLPFDEAALSRAAPMEVDHVDLLMEGVCEQCRQAGCH